MYKSALTITRKLCFRLRRMLKNNDIAAHWESLSSSNFLVITLMFGHNKVRHDSQFLIPEHALIIIQIKSAVPSMSIYLKRQGRKFATVRMMIVMAQLTRMFKLLFMPTPTMMVTALLALLYLPVSLRRVMSPMMTIVTTRTLTSILMLKKSATALTTIAMVPKMTVN